MKQSGIDWSNIGSAPDFQPTSAHHLGRANFHIAAGLVACFKYEAENVDDQFAALDTAWLAGLFEIGMMLRTNVADDGSAGEHDVFWRVIDTPPFTLKLRRMQHVDLECGAWVLRQSEQCKLRITIPSGLDEFKIVSAAAHVVRSAGGISWIIEDDGETLANHICRTTKIVQLNCLQLELLRSHTGAPAPTGRRSRAALVEVILRHLGFEDDFINKVLSKLAKTVGLPGVLSDFRNSPEIHRVTNFFQSQGLPCKS